MKIPKNWTFSDNEVAKNFDNHVREQLPWYDMVSFAISQIGNHYIPENGIVYDIGASIGNIEKVLSDTLKNRRAFLIPIEKSKEMVDNYVGQFEVIHADATKIEYHEFDFGVCFLSLMFISPHLRRSLIDNMMSNLRQDGALVVVEKTIPVGGYVSTVMSRLTLRAKLDAGANPKDIIEKELSLSGIQRPISPDELFDGYKYTEFFRYGEFGGYILEKI